ncbi:MAG: cytochrome c oxidase assembly protein, partial [Acidimicrobiales bacterium]
MTAPLASLFALLPPLAGSSFLRTYVNPVPIAVLALGLVVYLGCVRHQNRLHPVHPWPVHRTLAYAGGTLVTLVAVCSFLGAYDRTLFWVHMVQHLMLIMVAASLFAVSSPIALAWRATSGRRHRTLTAALRSRPGRILGHPVTAFVLYGLLVPLTHLTVFFNDAIASGAVDELEHLCFVVVGYLFWRQLFGVDPNRYRVQPAMRALLLFLAVPVDTFVGLTLNSETHEIFPAFAAEHRTWGPSLVLDLHLGGVVMWVGGDVLMMLALIPVVVAWVRREERHATIFDRELEAYFPPSTATGQPTAGFALGAHAPRARRTARSERPAPTARAPVEPA